MRRAARNASVLQRSKQRALTTMTFIDLVRLAAGNLWRRRTRTLLTVLGVFIGTACITIMVAISLGSLEQFQQNIMENNDLTRIEVYANGNDAKLNVEAVDKFRALPGVKSAAGVLNMPGRLKMGKYEYDGQIVVADPQAMDFEFVEGGPMPNTSALELVVGWNAREYFRDPRDNGYGGGYYIEYGMDAGDDAAPLGPDVDWLEMHLSFWPGWSYGDEESTPERPAAKEYRAKICGLLGPAYDQNSYSIFMSDEAAARIFSENRRRLESDGFKLGEYEYGYINAVDVDAVQPILDAVRDMGYQVYSDTEWINQMQEEQQRQQSQLVAIGLISLLVSAIGIANTMLASILERRREIGVMKVIGLSIRKINLMFLVEAAMIGLIGGVIGVALSYIMSILLSSGQENVNFLGMYFDQGVQMSIPWWLAAGSIAIAAGVGILSGLYPAWKATRMSPLEAIRGTE